MFLKKTTIVVLELLVRMEKPVLVNTGLGMSAKELKYMSKEMNILAVNGKRLLDSCLSRSDSPRAAHAAFFIFLSLVSV